MDFDPQSREPLPPRHQLESDSEDDVDDFSQPQPGAAATSVGRSKRQTQIEWSGGGQTPGASSSALLLEGGAVGTLAPAPGPGQASGGTAASGSSSLQVDGRPEAILTADADPSVALLLPSPTLSSDYASSSQAAKAVIDALGSRRLTLVTTYNPITYIRLPNEDDDDDLSEAPIRYLLQSSPTSSSDSEASLRQGPLRPFEVPNAVTGFSAALLSQALVRPADKRPEIVALFLPSTSPQPHSEYYGSQRGSAQQHGVAPSTAAQLRDVLQALGVWSEEAKRSVHALRVAWAAQQQQKQSSRAEARHQNTAGDGDMYV